MDLYLLSVLENNNAILSIAISHEIKSIIAIGRKNCFNYIAQGNIILWKLNFFSELN